MENNLTLYIHGTFSNSNTFNKQFKENMQLVIKEDIKEDDIEWSGNNTKEARTEAAEQLLNYVLNYEFKEWEDLNIVAHSHGGNVVKEFSNLLTEEQINNILPDNTKAFLFATPNRDDYIMNDGVFDEYYNIYNVNDKLTQDWVGGTDFILEYIPNIFSIKNPSQTTNEAGAINIPVDQNYTVKLFYEDINDMINSDSIKDLIINSNKLQYGIIVNPIKGQLQNHTEMKNPETVNEIYNHMVNEYNDAGNNLDKYNNFMNIINQ